MPYRDKPENNGFPDEPKPVPSKPKTDPLTNLRFQLAHECHAYKFHKEFTFDEVFDVICQVTDYQKTCPCPFHYETLLDKAIELLQETLVQRENSKFVNMPQPRELAYGKYRKGLRYKF